MRNAFGLSHDGAAERHALPVSPGEIRDFAREQGFYAQEAGSLGDLPLDLGAADILTLERKADIVGDIHVRIERE